MKPIFYILGLVCFLPSVALADSPVSGHFRSNFVRAGVFEVPSNEFVATNVEAGDYRSSSTATASYSTKRVPTRAERKQRIRSAAIGAIPSTITGFPGRFIRSTLGTLSHPIN